ncbi:MAG: RNA polymerase subunit sigma-24 [Acidobacteria bacterium]|nr:MAG: RNA polymerase subunit sigma-24 [Acidobacteriota bacterium]
MIWKRRKAENPEPADTRADSEESPQLSQVGGVPSDMSSMAIRGAFPSTAGEKQLHFSDPTTLAETDDAQIMLRVREGDDAAFNYLVERYRVAMINFMYRMVHNASIAEELAQEVFLRVYRSRANYTADAKFTTWLYRIATNLAMNHARDNKHERPEFKASLDETDEDTGLSIDVADGTPNAEQEILRRERLRAIRKQVDALPERQRVAVMMHKYQELDYRQIAEILHLSESATKSLLFRAYEALRQSLKDFV